MARLTKIYYIKYSEEIVDGHGVPKLYRPDGTELKDHELDVEANNGVVFVFTIPSDGPELTLRFKKASDTDAPRQPLSWTEGEEPAWVTLYDPTDPPSKTLSMAVENADPMMERRASFNLNLYDTTGPAPFILRIQEDGVEMPLDPTIVEKAPDPPHG